MIQDLGFMNNTFGFILKSYILYLVSTIVAQFSLER